MKKQVIVIHGGSTYDTYAAYLEDLKKIKIDMSRLRATGWKESLQADLGQSYEIVAPRMPNAMNAKYLEWKIWFEKLIPHLHKEIVLIGHSLGGIFLAKYLSTKKIPRKIRAVILVAPPFKGNNPRDSLGDFDLPKNMKRLAEYGPVVRLYHSSDDRIVRASDFKRYLKALPQARVTIFKDRGHFTGEKFPELVKAVRAL